MDSKKYIVGVIKDEGKKVGALLYNFSERKIEVKSFNLMIEEYKKSKSIIGIKETTQYIFSIKKNMYEDKVYYSFSKNHYDVRKLPVVDCEGNIIEAGANVCIGTIGIGSNKKYIVVDCTGKIEMHDINTIKEKKPVGVITYNNRVNVIKCCKNVYMTEKEFNENKTEVNKHEEGE